VVVSGSPIDLHDALNHALSAHRHLLWPGLPRERYDRLRSLLEVFVTHLPDDELAHDLYSTGLLRMYPTPEGGYRALPHPLLIESLTKDR
jgi:hypothetical protein